MSHITTKIDWTEAQKLYIGDTTCTYAKVAERFGVSEAAVRKVSQKYNWVALRAISWEQTLAKLPEKISDEASKYKARKYNHGKILSDAGVHAVMSQQDKISPYVGILAAELGHKLQTEALDLDKKDAPTNNVIFISLADFSSEMKKRVEERTRVNEAEIVK